jgi:phosphoribosylaminoimidazolecarboxamide formyltransferase/IMP cyclohydrolase
MPRALLSVYDKVGLTNFAQGLAELGWELVASGGTARTLTDLGLPVLPVERITNAPEMLGGRVKTLHPAIHGAILARDSAADRAELGIYGYTPIDMVVCNLYPFAEATAKPGLSQDDVLEQIDIGGVALLRAAAKNFPRVVAVCDPADYQAVYAALRANGAIPLEMRRTLAAKAFAHTRDYDTAIAAYFTGQAAAKSPDPLAGGPFEVHFPAGEMLRYGENPHQLGAFFSAAGVGPLGGSLLGGNKQLSYNNLLDLDAAWRAVEGFEAPAVVIVKHLNPCGVAEAPTITAALPHAIASDPVSAFGGVIATNRPVDSGFVEALGDLFLEALAAPSFSPDALEMMAKRRKNCRLLQIDTAFPALDYEYRSVRGGALVQRLDRGDPAGTEWRSVGQRPPTDDELAALRFAWRAAQSVKSNAIVLARALEGGGFATVGIGGGLPSRVDAAKLAVEKAGSRAAGAVMASDAFFPFADSVEVAAAAGVVAVVSPGGSVRDAESVQMADQHGMAMVFTGVRHFRH